MNVATLTELYGDDPNLVGVVDGTEDDFGDMVVDLLAAVGVEGDEAEAAIPALEELLIYSDAPTWEAAIALARRAVS